MSILSEAAQYPQGLCLTEDDDALGFGIFAGNVDLLIDGYDVPEPSYYLKNDGTLWKKIGSNPTDWKKLNFTGDVGSFGYGFQFVTDETLSSTTSNTWQTKLTLNTTTLDAGDYRIGSTYKWYQTKNNGYFEARILVDTVEKYTHSEAGKGVDDATNTNFIYVTFLTTSTHTIELQFRAKQGRGTSAISHTILDLWGIPTT